MNFATLINSFYLNFITSAMINLTGVTTELAITGGGRAGAAYLLVQTLLFAFALRSIFIGILYDIIVNKSADSVEQVKDEVKDIKNSPLDPDTSFVKTQKPSPFSMKRQMTLSPDAGVRSPMKSSVGGYSEFAFSPDGPTKSFREEREPKQLDFTSVVHQAMQLSKKNSKKQNRWSKLKSFLTEKYKVNPPKFYLRNKLTSWIFKAIYTRIVMYIHSSLAFTNIVLLIILASDSENRSVELACSVVQIALLVIYALMCFAVGLDTTMTQGKLLFETFIVVFCIADCITNDRIYSYYSCLNILRLLLFVNEIIRLKVYRNALEFVKSAWGILNYFLVLILIVTIASAQIGYLSFRDMDLISMPQGIFTRFPFLTFKESISTAFNIVFGNAWQDVFYRGLSQFGHSASVYFFLLVLICKQIIFSIIVAFLLEHMKKLLEKINNDKKKRMIQKINRMKQLGIAATLNKLKPSNAMRLKLKGFIEEKKAAQKTVNDKNEGSESDSNSHSNSHASGLNSQFSKINDPNEGKVIMPGAHLSMRDTPFRDLLKITSPNVPPPFKRSEKPRQTVAFQINLQEAGKSPSIFSEINAPMGSPMPEIETRQILAGVVRFVSLTKPEEKEDIEVLRRKATERKLNKRNTHEQPRLPSGLFQSPDFMSMVQIPETGRPMLYESEDSNQDRPAQVMFSLESNAEDDNMQPLPGDKQQLSTPVIIHWKKRDLPKKNTFIMMKDTFCKNRRDSSLFILHKRSVTIMTLQASLEKPCFEYFFVVVALAAVIMMAMNHPSIDPDSVEGRAIWWAEITLNSLFTLEFILKSLAYGLVFEITQKKPYLKQIDRVIDFMVTIVTWISLLLTQRISYFYCLKPFRVIRLLNFLKNVGRSNSFSLILSTIFGAAVKTSVFVAFVFISMHPHVIIRMYTHGEPFYICTVAGKLDTYLSYPCPADMAGHTQAVEVDFTRYWKSLLGSFVVITNEGFFRVSKLLMLDVEDQQLSYLYIFMTILSYYFLSQFLQNMFACVTILNYSEKKQAMDRISNLTERELKIFDQQKVFISKDLLNLSEKSRSDTRLQKLFLSTLYYDAVSFLLLIVVIVLMCLTGSISDNLAITIIQIIILAWNNIEVILKVTSMGLWNYLRDSFNMIDLISVVGCDTLLILCFSNVVRVNFMTPVLIKVLGLGRVLRRLLKSEHRLAKGMKSIFDALIRSFVYLLPMLAIIIITLTGFAISGMHLFSRIPLQQEVNQVFNFQTFVPSFIVMLKLLTGHRWHLTLAELVENTPGCISSQSYDDLRTAGPRSCGEDLGYVFVLLYIIVSRFVLLNLITVLVIDGYLESRKLENMSFQDSEVEKILQTWALYDPERSGLMKCNDFILFLYHMPEPFGVDKAKKNVTTKELINKFFSSEDNKIIVNIKDLLETARRYQLVVYEINNGHYIHFVDYITYITNKVNSNSKGWSSLDLGPRLFLHFKLTDQWKKKFPKYTSLEKKEDFTGRPFMLLQHYYAYKVVVRKIMAYSRLHRIKNKPFIGTGKEVTKNLCVEGSNMTRNKSLSFLYYNNLIQSKAPEKRILKAQETGSFAIQINRTSTKDDSLYDQKTHRKSNRRIGQPKKSTNEHSKREVRCQNVPEMETVNLNLDPIFTEKDIDRADHPYSSSNSSNHDSM